MVLKQTWIRQRLDDHYYTEKDFLGERPIENVGEILWSVRSESSNTQMIRHDVASEPCKWDDGLCVDWNVEDVMQTTEASAFSTEDMKAYILSQAAAQYRGLYIPSPATSRALTRTLMRTYGWPIQFFKDLVELVTVLRDAIQGESSCSCMQHH